MAAEWRGYHMIIKELLLMEEQYELEKIKDWAKGHYPGAKDEDEALLYFLTRSVNHAKDDDRRQDVEIDSLEDKEYREVKQLAARIADVAELEDKEYREIKRLSVRIENIEEILKHITQGSQPALQQGSQQGAVAMGKLLAARITNIEEILKRISAEPSGKATDSAAKPPATNPAKKPATKPRGSKEVKQTQRMLNALTGSNITVDGVMSTQGSQQGA